MTEERRPCSSSGRCCYWSLAFVLFLRGHQGREWGRHVWQSSWCHGKHFKRRGLIKKRWYINFLHSPHLHYFLWSSHFGFQNWSLVFEELVSPHRLSAPRGARHSLRCSPQALPWSWGLRPYPQAMGGWAQWPRLLAGCLGLAAVGTGRLRLRHLLTGGGRGGGGILNPWDFSVFIYNWGWTC